MLNLKRVSTKVIFAAIGAGYLATMSSFDINIFIKPYVAIVPIQLMALAYAIYIVYSQADNNK